MCIQLQFSGFFKSMTTQHSQQCSPKTGLTSSDYSRLLAFTLLMLPTMFIVGIVPAIFLIFGLVMGHKKKDFSHIEVSVRSFTWYCLIVGLVGAGFNLWEALEYYQKISAGWDDFYGERMIERLLIARYFLGAAVSYIFFVRFLYLYPLRGHRESIAKNGFFKADSKTTQPDVDIIKGERLKSYSVADELLKWAKLKDEGHISQEQFDIAKAKLLQRD